jgi:hypothetical protein
MLALRLISRAQQRKMVEKNIQIAIVFAFISISQKLFYSTNSRNQHIFANHLQWSVLTDKPWTEGANIYYAVSNHATPESPVINLDQPSLYFMPNWWNKIQQAAGIPNTSPFAIQLNNAAIPVPSDSPISNPIVYHSHPPQDHVETSDEHPRPSATITVVNEEADLLPQSAKEAQELLQQIQSQLQRLNEPKKDEVTKSMEVQSTTQSTTTKQPLTTTTQPTARIVSVENAKITQNQTKSYHVKYDEAPARAPQRKIYSQETEVVEPYRPPNLKIRQHKLENSAKSKRYTFNINQTII